MPKMTSCRGCGRRRYRTKGSDALLCHDCRRQVHGANRYKAGCRCRICRDAKNAEQRAYAAMVKARDGVSLSAKYGHSGNAFIDRAGRMAIYERDGWVCQICFETVPRNAHYNDRLAATLDHIEPQTLALIPDHRPSNLRLVHRGCNSERGNRVDAA